MIAPHLTEANQEEVLARARYRTKKELGRLVRELHPLPEVPDSVEPIGLLPKSARNSSWGLYMAALAGPVRTLKPGERPHDWVGEPAEMPGVARAANDRAALHSGMDARDTKRPHDAKGPHSATPHGATGANDADPLPPGPPDTHLPIDEF